MRISDWSSDVCSSDLRGAFEEAHLEPQPTLAQHVAVVGAEDDHGVLRAAAARENVEQTADLVVEIGDVGEIGAPGGTHQIGRASCRERGCQYVSISVVAV